MNIKDLAESLFSMAGKAQSIAITTHHESDGDGMVTAFALQHLLLNEGYSSCIVSDNEDLSQYDFLKMPRMICPYTQDMHYDLVIVVDCNSYNHLGQREGFLKAAPKVAVIDHHILLHEPIRADLAYVDTAFASVGALFFRAFEQQISRLSLEEKRYIAECVYVTLINDTNNFVNANTDAEVFRLAADLVKLGARPHQLYMDFKENRSVGEMLYVGHTLSTIELLHEGQILFLHSNIDLKQKCSVEPADIEQPTRYVQGVRGLAAIVYFREDKPGLWKLSLRSLNLNVQEIAVKFNGGGHRQAAGCRITGSLSEVKALMLQELSAAIAKQ